MISYYDGPDIEELVLGALRASGRSLDPLDPDDLAGLDEFHALGRAGTLALADLADVRPGELVVDVGAGIGGPSRVLARHYGATVAALEPTRRFASLARTLTNLSGLRDQVTIVEGDGRTLPFADASFDLAWTGRRDLDLVVGVSVDWTSSSALGEVRNGGQSGSDRELGGSVRRA
jgi:SAM-dependent methyltransferase